MADILDIERGTAAAQGPSHRPELQSLRGIAALIVLLHHCGAYYSFDDRAKYIAEMFLNAHACVVLFFVLSGSVLFLSLTRRPLTIRHSLDFYVRRAARIYPALFVSILLALFCVGMLHDHMMPGYVEPSLWPQSLREYPDSLSGYALSFLGMRTNLAIPIWTLHVELVVSLVMPALACLILFVPTLFLLFSVATAAYVMLSPYDVGMTLEYFPSFLFGGCVVILKPLLARLRLSGTALRLIAVAGALLLLFGRHLFVSDFKLHYDARPPAIVEALGAALLIAAMLQRQRLIPWLGSRGLVWLGDVSYSLYLLHLPVILLVAGVGGEIWGLPILSSGGLAAAFLLAVAVLVITTILAAIVYRVVELPGISVGKRLSSHARSIGKRPVGVR